MLWIKRLILFTLREATALVAMAIASGVALAIILIADAGAAEEGERTFDRAALEFLHPGANPADPVGPRWLDRAVLDLTSLGSIAVLATIALVACGFLLLRQQRLRAMELIVAMLGGILISETLKEVFERERPPAAWWAAEAINASFPSGHALLSTVVYLVLGAMLAGAVNRKSLRAYIMGCAIALALIVGLSRIWLGVHWTSDVVAGWCVGATWATVCWLAGQGLERRLRKRANEG